MAAKKTDDDRSLKRLGGGRWQTRDERFTIEPQSGTWALVDAEQTDDLGLPLVRGPYRSLTEAKAAVEAARGTDQPESPLADRVKEARARPPGTPDRASPVAAPEAAHHPAPGGKPARVKPVEPTTPAEPHWIADLGPRDRGRARRLIEALVVAGVRDAASVVRQDLTGGVPTVARFAIADHLAALLPTTGEEPLTIAGALGPVVEALAEGRDDGLDVRWRLVDGEDRPIGLTAADVRTAIKRRAETAGKGSDR
jgi:hypothetical protein